MARSTVLGIRLSGSERAVLMAAATERGEALSAYLRRVSVEAARRDVSGARKVTDDRGYELAP